MSASDVLLRGTRDHPPLGRPGGGGPCLARTATRHRARRDRHQRRGQVHADQHPVRRDPALQRPGGAAGPGRDGLDRSRAAPAPAWAAATSATPSTPASRCSRTAAWPRRPARRSPGPGGSDAQRCTASMAQRAQPPPAPGWTTARARAGLLSPRPEAPAGDCHVPGHRAAGAAAGRAAGRHGRRRDRAHAGPCWPS
jgi:hypothetical protein